VGGVFALSTERELTVADRISKMVRGRARALLQFGHRAVMRLAPRTRVHRQGRLRDSRGGYHGLFDAAMWFTPMDKWSQVGDPEVKPYSEGVPISTRSFAHFVQANDANQLEDVLKRHSHRIACLLIEPIMGNCLGIAASRSTCGGARIIDKHGVVLLIDEVKTGFRVARGGVQELYGVKADLCTFAKAVANGYPSRCWRAARRSCARSPGRRARRHVYCAFGIAARGEVLQILDETDALERIADYGTRLRNGMRAVLGARGIAHSFVGHPR